MKHRFLNKNLCATLEEHRHVIWEATRAQNHTEGKTKPDVESAWPSAPCTAAAKLERWRQLTEQGRHMRGGGSEDQRELP